MNDECIWLTIELTLLGPLFATPLFPYFYQDEFPKVMVDGEEDEDGCGGGPSLIIAALDLYPKA